MLALASNFQIQIIALILSMMIAILYGNRKKLHIYREFVFGILIYSVLITIVMDVLSGIVVLGYTHLPDYINDAIRKIYLISVVFIAFSVLLYTLAEVYQGRADETGNRSLFSIPLIVSILIIAKLNVVLPSDEYKFGPAVYMSMFFVVVYICICLYYGAFKSDDVDRHRRNSIFFASAIFFICGIVQLFNQQLRLMSLGAALILVYMYLGLEHADVYMDREFGVFNRDAFYIYLENNCNEKKKVALLCVMVKNIEKVVELAGNTTADGLLRQVADYLSSFSSARVFYTNDNCFIMTFEKEAHFIDYAHDIRKRFDRVWEINGGVNYEHNIIELEIGASVLVYPVKSMEGIVSSEEVIRNIAFYMDKLRAGEKSEYMCIDRRQVEELKAYAAVIEELKNVVSEGRIDVFFQPILSIYENRCREVEALVRIRNHKNEYFKNSHVIPISEQSGEIINIGDEVFRQICGFIAANNLESVGIRRVAVNLSMVQCQQKNMADKFLQIMENYNLPATMFRFEISERTAAYQTQNFKSNVAKLVAVGAQFAIDDYGKGRVDADSATMVSDQYIKLGEKAIKEYFSNKNARRNVRVICKLLQNMKMSVAAVGVETQRQYIELKKLGITYMQGNFFYEPMIAEQLIATLGNEKAMDLGQEVYFEKVL